jgi:SAM-dependent methyltransferase
MGWYDLFAPLYDASVERLYAPYRALAAERLALVPGLRVLDAGCGTGQSFDVLCPAVGPTGLVLGVDRSGGMLARARRRAAGKGFENVRLLRSAVEALDREALAEHLEDGLGVDRVLDFLCAPAVDDWRAGFGRLWSLLEPGGTMVIVTAHADRLGLQGRMVNLTAQADIRRRVWEALEEVAEAFELERREASWEIGGDMCLARGRKPG